MYIIYYEVGMCWCLFVRALVNPTNFTSENKNFYPLTIFTNHANMFMGYHDGSHYRILFDNYTLLDASHRQIEYLLGNDTQRITRQGWSSKTITSRRKRNGNYS